MTAQNPTIITDECHKCQTKNLKWRTTTMLKIVFLPHFREILSDYNEIL